MGGRGGGNNGSVGGSIASREKKQCGLGPGARTLEGGGGRDNVWGRGSNVSRGEETMYVGEDTMCVLRMTGYPLPPSLAQITSSTTATLPLRRSHPIQPVHKDRPTLTRFEPQNNSIPTAISTGTTMMA